MKIYGQELRQTALHALKSGQPRRAVAEMMGVSVPTLDRWRREVRQSGQVASRPRGHKRCAFGPVEQERLLVLLREAPDATVDEHLHTWRAQHGQHGSRASLARAIVRLNWTRKKRV